MILWLSNHFKLTSIFQIEENNSRLTNLIMFRVFLDLCFFIFTGIPPERPSTKVLSPSVTEHNKLILLLINLQ